MRVLYIIGGAKKAYGSERVAMNIVEKLSEQNINFVVVTANKGPVNKLCDELGIENHVVSFKFFVYKKQNNKIMDFVKRSIRYIQANIEDWKAMLKIESLVDMKDIDIIHSNLSRNLLGGKLAKKFNLPHVWHLQELYSGHYGLSLLIKSD